SYLNGQQKILGKFNPSEYVEADGRDIKNFKFEGYKCFDFEDTIGAGKKFEIRSSAPNLSKMLTIKSYNNFPTMLCTQVRYTNVGKSNLKITCWTNNDYQFSAVPRNDTTPLFWAYLPGSYGWSNDWIQPLNEGFERKNYLGMNWVDYGGGTPVLDIWRQDVGMAIGNVERSPKIVSYPVSMKTKNYVTMSTTYENPFDLKPGESFTTFNTFVSVHQGDCFQALRCYSDFMVGQGVKFKEPPKGAYQPIWCGWGYEKDFTPGEFYGTFPEIKKLGLEWIVLDDGWHSGLGDYKLDKKKFPRGDASMKELVDSIHSIGAKAKLWWNPLAVAPSTEMFQEHPEDLLLNKDGSPVYIQYWRSFFLCPACTAVRDYARSFVTKALKVWGFDGLKMDGNNLNTVPPCYNPEHHHSRPEESTEGLPEFFKMIYETALNINPEAVIEICPCGTNYSFYILPFMNQSVASDPQNSWQIRQKGKVLKALSGSKVVFYGDHVELSDGGNDFASTIGIGGVPGTKFVWPDSVHRKLDGDVGLTPKKEEMWAKWITIYKENTLSEGIYRGDLYDIGYDRPETHTIQKGDTMYYSFYDSTFTGTIELRGLKERSYEIFDYVDGKYLDRVKGPLATLTANFKKYLLIKAVPR
ncbi:MAG: glycoside hydrolase family 36 protein, partial [Bacteroidota bacterium]